MRQRHTVQEIAGAPRITLLTHSYWPESSPPQRRWSALVRELDAAGWQVDVVTPVAHTPNGRRKLPRKEAGYAFCSQKGKHAELIRRLPYLRHGNSHMSKFIDQCFSALLAVPLGLLTRGSDVVLVTAPGLPMLGAGYAVSKLRKLPLIVEMRDAWPDLAKDARLVKGNVKSLAERAVEFVQRRADLVVTVTDGFAETLRNRGLENVATVSNGVMLESLPALEPPSMEKRVFEALYLGNHGKSQRLEVAIQAAALVGNSMHLHMVGHGVQKPALERLARDLKAPVTFHDSLHGQEVIDCYASADTCIVSLRDDWKSFETTVPSKTYEVLALGRHVTGIVLGEAARILEEADAGDIVPSSPEAVAQLWRELAADRAKLVRGANSRHWVKNNADYPLLAARYMELILNLLAAKTGARG